MIVKNGNPILTNPCDAVTRDNYSKYLNRFLLRSIPHRKNGIGISANQVNLPYRICSIRSDDYWQTLINPKITRFYGKKIVNLEGCLSITGKQFNVERDIKIDVTYRDVGFNKATVIYTYLKAIVVQHELDHLNGILISTKGTEHIE